jgi:hypothetical protein
LNFAKQNLWASRFGSFAASRRAIRSISHFSPLGFRGWFRFYPSRFAPLVRFAWVAKKKIATLIKYCIFAIILFKNNMLIFY